MTYKIMYLISVLMSYIIGQMKESPKLGELEQLLLLAVLRLGDDAYGVTIQRELSSIAGRKISLGAIYTTMDRLEAKRYVSSTLGGATPERGGRSKRFFIVEGGGRAALAQSLDTIRRLARGVEIRVKGI